NATENGLADRLTVVTGDFRSLVRDYRGCDLVFANPPFYPLGQGHVSRDPEVRAAKFELHLTLHDLLLGGAAMLAGEGILCLIYPARRKEELLATAETCGLFPRRLRDVAPFAAGQADRFLVELGRQAGEVLALPPLILFVRPGEYTPEMMDVLAGSDP
ncbi:MAG TPA: hypothetical protein PKK12_05905, partial [Candidatus Aminicenantes bacterium]|nr:hypothetical protein [Candidatus Aminicenantes bacterium]